MSQADPWWQRPVASEPGNSIVTLDDGSEISLTASGYWEEDGVYVFSL